MSSKEEYDVLRLIEHGQTCYISSECVAGKILAGWLKNQPGIAKGRLFSMIRDVAGQLGMIHRYVHRYVRGHDDHNGHPGCNLTFR